MTHVAFTRKITARRTEPKEEDETKEMSKRTKPLSRLEKDVKQDSKREVLGTNRGTILSTKLNSRRPQGKRNRQNSVKWEEP